MDHKISFFTTVIKEGAEYGVDVVAEFFPECPPVSCMNPDHPSYSDPGSEAELDILEAKVVEYPDLDDPHGEVSGREKIGSDISHLLTEDDVSEMIPFAAEAWMEGPY